MEIFYDPNQPFSCAQWGSVYNILMAEGNVSYYSSSAFIHLFEDTMPLNVLIDHEMKVNYIFTEEEQGDAILLAADINNKIEEMIEIGGLSNDSHFNLPNKYSITNIYPNPFNPVVNINVDISLSGFLDIEILNIRGTYVKTLYSGFLHSGNHEISWNAESMPSGVYLVSLKDGEKNLTEKVVLLK